MRTVFRRKIYCKPIIPSYSVINGIAKIHRIICDKNINQIPQFSVCNTLRINYQSFYIIRCLQCKHQKMIVSHMICRKYPTGRRITIQSQNRLIGIDRG